MPKTGALPLGYTAGKKYNSQRKKHNIIPHLLALRPAFFYKYADTYLLFLLFSFLREILVVCDIFSVVCVILNGFEPLTMHLSGTRSTVELQDHHKENIETDKKDKKSE